jgi:hypothetical protein
MMNNYSKAKDELIYQGHLWAYNKIKEIGATHAVTLSFSAPFTAKSVLTKKTLRLIY